MKKYIVVNLVFIFIPLIFGFLYCLNETQNYFISIIFGYGIGVIMKAIIDNFIKNFK